MISGHRPGTSKSKASGGFLTEALTSINNLYVNHLNLMNMNPKIVFKLTMKVPGTKLLVDFLFGTREELESFLDLNKLKPYEVRMVINGNEKKS